MGTTVEKKKRDRLKRYPFLYKNFSVSCRRALINNSCTRGKRRKIVASGDVCRNLTTNRKNYYLYLSAIPITRPIREEHTE